MAYPSSVADIDARITALSASAVCRVANLPEPTIDGRQVKYIEVSPPNVDSSTPVAMFVGGLHAREWAPPDAVLSFAEALVRAYDGLGPVGSAPAPGTQMRYPSFRDGALRYAATTVSPTDVRRFVENLVILFIPMANPDGRDWSLTRNAAGDTGPQGAMWRGNRHVTGSGSCANHGVDLNRNFGWQWNLSPYYTQADETWILANAARGSCDPRPNGAPTFRGDRAASEPETRNVQYLIDTFRPQFLMDVHAYGRQIALPWAIAKTQTTDSTKTFGNAALDRTGVAGSGRSVTDGAYREYMPDTADHPLKSWQDVVAAHMVQSIRSQAGADAAAKARSTYRPVPTPDFYLPYFPGLAAAPLPGPSDEYAFSRPFRTNQPMGFACTLECGVDGDGEMGFFPPRGVKYQKIEREVHTAIWAILDSAVRGVPGTGAPL